MAEGLQWWISKDAESWYPAAGAASRRDAIAIGRDEYAADDESFYICEARRGEFDLRIRKWNIVELLELLNEERVDPEGDGVFARKLTSEETSDLETRVEAAIRGWFDAHGLKTAAWAFAEQRDEERIAPARDYPPDIRDHYHHIVACMGTPKISAQEASQ